MVSKSRENEEKCLKVVASVLKMAVVRPVSCKFSWLVFAEDGELNDEFKSLYNSLNKNAAKHIKIVPEYWSG